MMGPRGMLEQETRKPRSTGTTIRRLAVYFKPYWLILIGVLVLMIANAWTQVLTPELTGQAVDCYLTPAVTSQAAAAANAVDAADGSPAAPVQPNTTAAATNCWFGNVPAGAPIGCAKRLRGYFALHFFPATQPSIQDLKFEMRV